MPIHLFFAGRLQSRGGRAAAVRAREARVRGTGEQHGLPLPRGTWFWSSGWGARAAAGPCSASFSAEQFQFSFFFGGQATFASGQGRSAFDHGTALCPARGAEGFASIHVEAHHRRAPPSDRRTARLISRSRRAAPPPGASLRVGGPSDPCRALSGARATSPGFSRHCRLSPGKGSRHPDVAGTSA